MCRLNCSTALIKMACPGWHADQQAIGAAKEEFDRRPTKDNAAYKSNMERIAQLSPDCPSNCYILAAACTDERDKCQVHIMRMSRIGCLCTLETCTMP